MSRVYLKRYAADPWHEVVTDAKDEVRFTFTFDNLTNPTNYVSETSYSLKLPRCPENNLFFGEFCRLDSVIVAGGYDPTQKMQYLVLDTAGMIVSTGDAVISEINGSEYVLSLVGSQARLFRRLLNAGYDTAKAVEDDEYTLMTDWLKLVKTGAGTFTAGENAINAALVYASWLIDKPIFLWEQILSTNLKNYYGLTDDTNVTEATAFIASLIGFAPTAQGRYKDFESDVWFEQGQIEVTPDVYIPATDVSCLPVLCSTRKPDNSPVKTLTLENGTIDAQMQEFRSYYMQPYIYVSALWHLFRIAFHTITGYSLVLDSRWFKATNNDLRNLVYMLPPLSVEEGGIVGTMEDTQKVVSTRLPSTLITDYPTTLNATTPPNMPDDRGKMVMNTKTTTTSTSATVHCPAYRRTTLSTGLRVAFSPEWTLVPSGYENRKLYFSGFNPFDITVEVADTANNTILTKKYLLFALPTDGRVDFNSLTADDDIQSMITIAQRNGYEIVTANYDPLTYDTRLQRYVGTVLDIALPSSFTLAEEKDVVVRTTFTTYNYYIPFMYILNDDLRVYFYIRTQHMDYTQRITTSGVVRMAARSNSLLTLERLFGDIKPFEVLLKYAKTRGLLWLVDDVNKTVKVEHRADYFAECAAQGFVNVSGKADLSRSVKVSPLSWEEHRVVLNLDNIEVDGVEGYESRYGHTYGSKVIITANNLNKDTKDLLEGVSTSALYGQTVAPCGVLKQLTDASQATFVEVSPMPANVKDGESAGVSGNFYYRHDNDVWQAALQAAWHGAYITDDYKDEADGDKYCWHGLDILASTGIAVDARPVLRTVSADGLSVLFAPVREQYTSTPDNASAYLYEHCWKNYIEEVYNAQNKTLEAYLHLPRNVFDKVRKNPLVVLDHVLYLLTEIRSWGEHNTLCRCTLRQITNINNLTT